jgi:hypothetical protein
MYGNKYPVLRNEFHYAARLTRFAWEEWKEEESELACVTKNWAKNNAATLATYGCGTPPYNCKWVLVQ